MQVACHVQHAQLDADGLRRYVERADLGVRWSNGVLRVSGGGLQVIFR